MAVGSASKLARWRRCKHQCWYSDVLDLQPLYKSLAPERGTLIHQCLDNYYTGKDWTLPIANLKLDLDKVFDEEREEWASLPQELYKIVRGYVASYKATDTTWTILATEYKVDMKLNEKHSYIGYIDLIIMDDAKRVWIVDHKTVKAFPEEREMYMDLQLSMYLEAVRQDKVMMGKIKTLGGTLTGVMFNHISTKTPREPQLLKSGGLSKAACNTDVRTYFEAVRKLGLDVKDYEDMIPKLENNVFYRRTKLPVNPATVEIIRNEAIATLDEYETMKGLAVDKSGAVNESQKTKFTRSMLKQRCSWDCPFIGLCITELAGRPIADQISNNFEQRVNVRDTVEVETDGE